MENTNVNDLIKSIESNELGGSIYSREDVTRILKMVRVERTSNINIDYIVQDLRNLYDNVEDIKADTDSAEFSLVRGNEIELDSVDVDTSTSLGEIDDIISKLYDGVYIKSDVVQLEREN